jgi:outer membrane autotransporter protein
MRSAALFAYANTSADLDNEGITSKIVSYSPGAYATYFDGPMYWNGLVSYSRNSYTSDRKIIYTGFNRTAHSDTYGNQYSVNNEAGYDFKVNHFKIGPTLGVEYVQLTVDGFTETGAGSAGLTVRDQKADSLRSRLGAKANRPFSIRSVALTSEVRAAWQHEYLDDSRDITASFNDPSAGAFAVHTTGPQRDSALLGAGLTAQVTKTINLFLNYDAQVGQKDFIAQAIQGGGRLRF